MYNSLLLKAFEKAETEIHSTKITHVARHLSDYIQEQSGEPYGERILREKYTAAINGNAIDLKKFVVEALSCYVGFETLEAYVQAHPATPLKKKKLWHVYKIPVIGIVVVLLVAFGYNKLTKERYMVWQENEYVEATFDEKLLQQGKLKPYDANRIAHFKKIVPNSETPYKSPEGKALLYYGKNATGSYEYFTALDQHPETDKPLKEVSKYIFIKYICGK